MYHKISGIEKTLGCGWGGWEGVSCLLVKIVLSHCAKKHRRVTLLCFTKFVSSETSMDKVGGGRKGYRYFLSKSFVPQRRKIS